MKKRVAIYVESGVWLELRKRCLDLGCSVGDYLVGLHDGVEFIAKSVLMTKQDASTPERAHGKTAKEIGERVGISVASAIDKDGDLRKKASEPYFRAMPKKGK